MFYEVAIVALAQNHSMLAPNRFLGGVFQFGAIDNFEEWRILGSARNRCILYMGLFDRAKSAHFEHRPTFILKKPGL